MMIAIKYLIYDQKAKFDAYIRIRNQISKIEKILEKTLKDQKQSDQFDGVPKLF
jgi:hypothetical protein